jgi:hypothetical protein
MPLTDAQRTGLAQLKDALQGMTAREFERLAAQLVEKRIDVRLSVAKSGFQHGADAGTAGRVVCASRRSAMRTRRR